jgi:hypothetical protein
MGIGDVHEGFWCAMTGIAIRADVAIDGRPCVLSGHSLGGAIALALGAHRCLMGKPPKAIITFGAPRIGLGSAIRNLFARCNVDVWLYRNGADPIPHEPPCIEPFMDWEHPADITQLGEDGLFPDILDHQIARYIEAFEGGSVHD